MHDTLRNVDPSDLVLLLASEEFAPDVEPESLDRVRVQKAIYILQESGPEDWRNLFEYMAWDWGPFSKDLAAALDRLVEEGFLKVEPVPYHHPRFRTTNSGERHVRHLIEHLDSQRAEFIAEVRRYVTSRSFDQLLREVYGAYPEMAARSRFVRS
jgi:uncharacterized protein YwgA